MGYRSAADGVASKGKTKGKMLAKGGAVKMKSGGQTDTGAQDRKDLDRKRMFARMAGREFSDMPGGSGLPMKEAQEKVKKLIAQQESGPFKKGGKVKESMMEKKMGKGMTKAMMQKKMMTKKMGRGR